MNVASFAHAACRRARRARALRVGAHDSLLGHADDRRRARRWYRATRSCPRRCRSARRRLRPGEAVDDRARRSVARHRPTPWATAVALCDPCPRSRLGAARTAGCGWMRLIRAWGWGAERPRQGAGRICPDRRRCIAVSRRCARDEQHETAMHRRTLPRVSCARSHPSASAAGAADVLAVGFRTRT